MRGTRHCEKVSVASIYPHVYAYWLGFTADLECAKEPQGYITKYLDTVVSNCKFSNAENSHSPTTSTTAICLAGAKLSVAGGQIH